MSAGAQYVQGTDQQGNGVGTPSPDPDDWTEVLYDTVTDGTTITFELNPCEWVLYRDVDGRPHSCLPRDVSCATLADMETKLEDALDVWNQLDPNALTFVVNQPATCEPGCDGTFTDAWEDDGAWVVTRTYDPGGALDPQVCPNVATTTGAEEGGAGLRLYEDPAGSNDVRWVRECDIVFFADKWDNAVGNDCLESGLYDSAQCGGAWQLALAHEVGHCLGFGHSYQTRKTLGPLKDDLKSDYGIELAFGLPSAMSYDRPGSVDLWNQGQVEVSPYDATLYLEAYSSGADPSSYFTAFGEVRDSCPSGDLQYGVGIFALESFVDDGVTKWRAVQTSLSGQEPLGPGVFRLEHLDRAKDYRLLVADLKNVNHALPNGWDFEDVMGAPPGLFVVRTDLWSETNSSDTYKYDMSGQFTTGFAYELFADFIEPQTGDYDAGCIELTFP